MNLLVDGPQFTAQQRQAIGQRATSVALSAGAGCGKTIDDALRALLARRDEAVMDLIVRSGLLEVKKMLRGLLGQRDKIDFAAWSARSADDVLDLWAAFHHDVARPQALQGLTECETAA